MDDLAKPLYSGMSFTLSNIAKDCYRLRRSIQPISERYQGYLHQRNFNSSKSPFVLLLGNNNSGKSNFINHVLNRPIQSTNLSSTDDCFTVIKAGLEDFDGSGQSVVADPDLGFNELQEFDPSLTNHTQLKIRANVAVKDVVFVDGPNLWMSHNKESSGSARGYNLDEACRWYAERADVVLLFVDPDKSGTPDETLESLKSSLKGLGDKVLIILNKTNPNQPFQDFIHSYGTLCWNLSRTVPTKELPRIHTICPPVSDEWNDCTDATAVSEFTELRYSLRSSYFGDQSHISLHESR